MTLYPARSLQICLAVFCNGLVLLGCAVTEQTIPPVLSNVQTEATPLLHIPDSGPPPLNEEEIERLKERFPSKQLEVFKNADQINVYEVDVTFTPSCPSSEELPPIQKNKFQGCRVLRHTRITDAQKLKEFVDAVFYSIGSWHSGNACWSPRHGVRAVKGDQRVELLICFECENFRGAPAFGPPLVRTFDGNYIGGRERFGGGISPAIEPLFETILSKASQR